MFFLYIKYLNLIKFPKKIPKKKIFFLNLPVQEYFVESLEHQWVSVVGAFEPFAVVSAIAIAVDTLPAVVSAVLNVSHFEA